MDEWKCIDCGATNRPHYESNCIKELKKQLENALAKIKILEENKIDVVVP